MPRSRDEPGKGSRQMRKETRRMTAAVQNERELGRWLDEQRRLYHEGKLEQWQIDKLDALIPICGCDWREEPK